MPFVFYGDEIPNWELLLRSDFDVAQVIATIQRLHLAVVSTSTFLEFANLPAHSPLSHPTPPSLLTI